MMHEDRSIFIVNFKNTIKDAEKFIKGGDDKEAKEKISSNKQK